MKQLSIPKGEQSDIPQQSKNNNHRKRTKEFRLKMGLQHREEKNENFPKQREWPEIAAPSLSAPVKSGYSEKGHFKMAPEFLSTVEYLQRQNQSKKKRAHSVLEVTKKFCDTAGNRAWLCRDRAYAVTTGSSFFCIAFA